MRDHFFFPLTGLFALGLIVLAIWPGIYSLPTGPVTGDGLHYDNIIVEGKYLNKIVAGGPAKVQLQNANDAYTVYIESEVGALTGDVESGPHFILGGDLEVQYSGRRVLCTVRARPTDDKGAMKIMMNYSAGRVGESGWKIFNLKPGFSDVSFEYYVPKSEGDQGNDFFGIRPVVPSKTRAIEIERVTFTRLPPRSLDVGNTTQESDNSNE